MEKKTVIFWNFRRIRYSLLLLLASIVMGGCRKEEKRDYLMEAIESDAILCSRIYTDYSDTIFVRFLPNYLMEDLIGIIDTAGFKLYIYEQLKDSLPIYVTKEFYSDRLAYQIEKDSLMESIYEEFGVAGLLKNYFKKGGIHNDLYIFWHERERFVVRGQTPIPAFGENQNLGYMCYLLSKHNIYMGYLFGNEILSVVIDPGCSDTIAVERYEKEGERLPYRRDPYGR